MLIKKNIYVCVALLLTFAYVYADEKDDEFALKEAENEVLKFAQEEEHMAQVIKDSKPSQEDAFRWVQKFLVSFPLANSMSKPGLVLEKIALAYLKSHDLSPEEAFALLENHRPLKEMEKLAKADDTNSDNIDSTDFVTCPYQPINCKDEEKAVYRTIDGSCNNLRHPLNGKAFTPLIRFLSPDYADSVSAPRKASDASDLPSARLVSSTLNTEKEEKNDRELTYMVMTWGQFVDHDIDLTAITKLHLNDSAPVDVKCGDSGCDGNVDGCFPIAVPDKDETFKGKSCLTFVRSQGVPNRQCSLGPRQHLNQITSYIDGSMVYGSTKAESDFLRDLNDTTRGRLKTSAHPFNPHLKHILPKADVKTCRGTTKQVKCIKAGDGRANEAPHLTMAHTVMVREHNRIEEALHRVNPQWSGEQLFQESRKIVGAVLQRVTYNEYLPAILSLSEMKKYDITLGNQGFFKGYDEFVDASITNVFATAAFRFGHSMIPSIIKRPLFNYTSNVQGDLKLSETLFRPSALYDLANDGIDGFVRGSALQPCAKTDKQFSDQVTKHLFADNAPNGIGTDLVSLNIQRGRDHGLPGYTAWRKFCELDPVESFEDLATILSPRDVVEMKKLYKNVHDIDLYPAALAESPMNSRSTLGETFTCILGKQFRNLRYGDRYWHERSGKAGFAKDQLQEIRKMTMAKLFCTNSDNVASMQADMMRVASPDNPFIQCELLPDIDFSKWKENEI